MIVDRFNEAAGYLALGEPFIETRLAFTVRPEDQTFRFVKDTAQIDLASQGWTYHPTPYAQFSGITSGDGGAADTATVTFDGATITSFDPSQTVDDVLQSIMQFPLRDRPCQISLLVLNIETLEIVSVIPQFVGFVDNTQLNRDKGNTSVLDVNMASFRARAQRRIARTYSDTDHRTRFPGDGACAWISDSVFRNGSYPWNTVDAGTIPPTPRLFGR